VNRLPRVLLALVLIAGGLLAILTSPATAATTATVHGEVTTGGVAVKGLKVELLLNSDNDPDIALTDSTFVPIRSDNTNTDGTYTFGGLTVRGGTSYGLRISDPKGWHATTYFHITPEAGHSRTFDESVLATGKVVGKVARADGASPTEMTAQIQDGPSIDEDSIIVSAEGGSVAADGSFALQGVLPSGAAPSDKYVIKFVDGSGKYLAQCYQGAPLTAPGSRCSTSVSATRVSVQAGQTTTLEGETLSHLAAHINGTVTDTFGHPLKGMVATVIPAVGDGTMTAPVRSTGRFSVGGLPAGQYKLSVADPTKIWAGQWYDNTTKSAAHVFDLADGQAAGGLVVKLKSRSTLVAKATPGVASVKFAVSVTRKASGSRPSGTVTVSGGGASKTVTLVDGEASVKLSGLPEGKQTFTIAYSGAGSTAPSDITVPATVK
jgi:Big-like domain-containing protein